ncbi:hypothetical protein QJS04_geneDACA016564 [Acorus gramineus]|uniref:Ribosomal protein L1 n=1 Tax=Acorus gramineus TaxID=55184 RepID=A0AAV9BSE0_ACOGR|nr:hypothetical protein QJS04_geneDACA016564 [Acorus gramineus]
MAAATAISNTQTAPPPALPPPSSSHLRPDTVGRAVDALLKWNRSRLKNQKAQLFEHDDLLNLVITLKKIPTKARTNPFRVPLPHPVHPFDGSDEICLIVDDRPRKKTGGGVGDPPSAKRKIEADGIPVSKVLKLSKLRTDYKPFEARRKLCDSYDLFLADRRIVHLLPRLLGKAFFKKKKIPVPVDLSRKDWMERIKHCCVSALLYLRTGTCCSLKIGRTSQSREEIVENVIAAVEGAVPLVPKKWGNVRSLHLKMRESLALPIYQTVPEMGLVIDGMQIDNEIEAIEGEEGEREVVVSEEKKKKKRGRIHEVQYMDVVGEEGLDGEEDGSVGDLEGKELKVKALKSLPKKKKKKKEEDQEEEHGFEEENEVVEKAPRKRKSEKAKKSEKEAKVKSSKKSKKNLESSL